MKNTNQMSHISKADFTLIIAPYFEVHKEENEEAHEEKAQELYTLVNNYFKCTENSIDLTSLNHAAPIADDELKSVIKTLYCSDFFKKNVTRLPHIRSTCHALMQQKKLGDLSQILFNFFLKSHDEKHFLSALRNLRNTIMSAVIYCDINRYITLFETTHILSDLTDYCIQTALDYYTQKLTVIHGTPQGEGRDQPFMVIGMGKLGAYELNLSSDIDLIFAYPHSGHTNHDKNHIENAVFFKKLGQKVIHALDTVTVDGFVFRVDMRLRPYGQSGALALPFAALEDYYQNQGREWERFAMVKARIVACTHTYAINGYKTELTALLNQFTYRKFIDFSVIDALRDLKKMIIRDIARRNLGDNIKLGAGGIREIEFIAQCFQLIRGGRDIDLQDNRISIILPLLAQHTLLTNQQVQRLTNAYIFLRNTEHALQAFRDEQTQTLPDTTVHQHRIAVAMDFENWAAFFNTLNQHRRHVSAVFNDIIALPEDSKSHCAIDAIWQHIWESTLDDTHALDALSKHRFETPKKTLSHIRTFQNTRAVKYLDEQVQGRLNTFMTLLMANAANASHPSRVLSRIMPFIESVIRRSAYLLLLIENPHALAQLVKLSDASASIPATLAKHPALLDELLDSRTLYLVPAKERLASELRATMLRIEPDDLEQQMEALRYFKAAHNLRIGACEISGSIPLMKVSDYLSMLAEVISNYVMQLCWQEMTTKHGYPDGDIRQTPNFVVVGYGKLGGIEMSYGSDLDLVFIHNAKSQGQSDGKNPIENTRFYTRLGQKIIHIMNTRTASGQLYEIDMRLRPSGNSGMLVSTLNAYKKYQHESAWTWEHQALVRARPIAGDETLQNAFNAIRKAVLCRTRDIAQLKKDIIAMRQKMRDHLGSRPSPNNEEKFHIKHDAGGIVDIEFMVQYAVLAWSNAEPALITYTDNIRIIECLHDAKLFSAQQANELIAAYKALRATGHRLALQDSESVISDASLKSEQTTVIKHWQTLLH